MMMNEKLIKGSKIWRNSELNIGIQFETNYVLGSEYNLTEAIEKVENGFLNNDLKADLKSLLETFLSHKKILEQKLNIENLFINENLIYSYLTAYYDLLAIFMFKDEHLFKDKSSLAILNNILYFGYDPESQEFSVYSPLVLNLVYKLKKLFEQYGPQIQKSGTNKLLESIYFHNILNYVQRSMGYSIRDEKQQKLFATPTIHISDNSLKLSFSVNSVSEIDSFKSLDCREVAEETLRELNAFLEDEKNITSHNEEIEFKVAILGNFEFKYLKEEFDFHLKNSVNEEVQKIMNSSKIHILIEQYASKPTENMETKICLSSNIDVTIHYCNELHRTLENTKQLKEIFELHQVVIFADCADFYDIIPSFTGYSSGNLKQRFAFCASFSDLASEAKYGSNMLDYLYVNMVTANTFILKQYGQDSTTLNCTVLDFCANIIPKNYSLGKFSTMYIGTSKASYHDIKFSEKKLLNYCSASYINDFRISTKLPNATDFPAFNQYGQYIAINMWQLIEVFGTETLKEHMEYILDTELQMDSLFSEFHDKYLYLDYSNFSSQPVKLLYKEEDRFYIEALILPLIENILHGIPGTLLFNMSKRYLSYILYHNSQSMADLLFTYLFFETSSISLNLEVLSKDLKKEISNSISSEKDLILNALLSYRWSSYYRKHIEKPTASKAIDACNQIGYNYSDCYYYISSKKDPMKDFYYSMLSIKDPMQYEKLKKDVEVRRRSINTPCSFSLWPI